MSAVFRLASPEGIRFLLERIAKLGRMVEVERKAKRDERDLLFAALHQLAERQGVKDRQAFARQWIARERRAWQRDHSIPVYEGGEDQRERS